MRWSFYLIACFLLGFRFTALHAETIVIGSDVKGVWIGQQLELLKDSSPPLTLEAIRSGQHEQDFFRLPRDIPTLGYFKGNSYWARFTLQNPTDEPIELYLISRYATTDYLTLYWPENNSYQSLTLGDLVAFDKRPLEHHFPIFPFTVPPGTHTYYMHMQTTTSVLFALSIWTPRSFQNHEFKETSYLGLLFGIGFVMLFYNFFIWLKFRSRAYLAYVCYIFSYLLFAAVYHGIVQQYVFPHMENGWPFQNFVFIVIEITCITSATFSIEFLSLRQSTPKLYRLVNGLRIFFALNLLNWLTWGYEAKRITMIDTFLISIVLISIGFYRSFSYRPARFYTVGWTLFLTGNLFMLLGSNGVINSTVIGPWSQFTGAVLELVLLSLALGDRVALINTERRKLHASLIQSEREKTEEREHHIRELDRLVFERTRAIKSILATINQGIFTIGIRDERLQVVSEYSQFLTSMLGTEDIRGRDPIELVFAQGHWPTETVDQIRQILLMSLGENRTGYEINSAHLPRDIVMHDSMFVEIDWLPMLNADDTVDHVLVILRDMTQMRKLREQARIQEHELLMMGELTSGPGRRFPVFQKKFLEQIQPFLTATLDKAQTPLTVKDRQRAAIFLHSFKGDARVFGLKSLSQAVHDAESNLQSDTVKDHEQLATLLQELLKVLRYYENIWKERLHFTEEKEATADDLQSVLKDHLQSLRKAAAERGKSIPQFLFQGTPGLLPRSMHSSISQAFGHILTNTLDHGLEAGSAPTTILFIQHVQKGFLEIEYSDNGRGLDIGSLQTKGVGLKPEEAAELIFQPGLSTAPQVSLTSGRGIGMAAVRELLEGIGGQIRLHLGAEKPGRPGFHTFVLLIRIPLQASDEQRKVS